jgi:hypothetical protein
MGTQGLYEEQRELQRRILYNKTCCYCNRFNSSCVYARSSDKATVVEYCICDKNSVMNKSNYICLHCGERKKIHISIKRHLENEHMNNGHLCLFCGRNLCEEPDVNSCIQYLNTHFPVRNGIVIQSRGKVETVQSVLLENRVGREKQPYINKDKELFHKRKISSMIWLNDEDVIGSGSSFVEAESPTWGGFNEVTIETTLESEIQRELLQERVIDILPPIRDDISETQLTSLSMLPAYHTMAMLNSLIVSHFMNRTVLDHLALKLFFNLPTYI